MNTQLIPIQGVLEQMEKTMSFANKILEELRIGVHLTLDYQNDSGESIQMRRWVGDLGSIDTDVSLASMYGPLKVLEVRHSAHQNPKQRGDVLFSPCPDFKFSPNFRGGVCDGNHAVGVSKLNHQLDRLVAMVVMYFYKYDSTMYLNAVGERFSSIEEFNASTAHGTRAESHKDRELAFRKVNADSLPYYNVYEYMHQGSRESSMYFDLICKNPRVLLDYVALGFDHSATIHENEGGLVPAGSLWVHADDDRQPSILGVRARSKVWEVENAHTSSR